MSKSFTIDARLVLQLGRDSIKDHTTALIELVKNSYDADATKVEVEIYSKKTKDLIRVADNGFGMTGKEIDNNWLRIGFSEKKKSKKSKRGRRKTGEKGIGRIATDRLGANLEMITKSENDETKGIELNWDDFDVDEKDVKDINISEIDNPIINIPIDEDNPVETGTEIIINNLRQEWSQDDIKKLYDELSFFTPLTNFDKEISIKLINDIDPSYSKIVKSAIFDVAEIQLDVYFDGDSELVYDFKNKLLPDKNKSNIIPKDQFITQKEIKELNCGPAIIKLHFFPRKSEILDGTSFKLSDLRDFLNLNAGVKIYRDNIAVKPYGFQNSEFGNDWLGLASRKAQDPAGISRATYKITPNQLVGSVFITRDENKELIDSSSREGLVENEALKDLKKLVELSITLLESHRIEIYNQLSQNKSKRKAVKAQIDHITNNLNSAVTDLDSLKDNISANKIINKDSVKSTISKIEDAIEKTQKTFNELLDEKRVLNGLATLGISSAVFGHETESAISTFKLATKNVKDCLSKKSPDIETAKEQLEIANNKAKIIASWGVYALTRIENEKRGKTPKKISKIIKDTIFQFKDVFNAQSIEIDEKNIKEFFVSVYPMDIESIFINLMTNAFTAVKNSARKRKIRIELYDETIKNVDGFYLIVADSGPGVAKEYISKIWEPLFTTKISDKDFRSGTGLGLTIVKSIIDELNGNIEYKKDSLLNGAKFIIWIPKK